MTDHEQELRASNTDDNVGDLSDQVLDKEEPSDDNNDTKPTDITRRRIPPSWKPEPWHHAFYHTTTSVLGVAALVALPYSFAYLRWSGGIVLLLAATIVSFLSGVLLIQVQEPHHRTYSEIADSIMGDGFSIYYVRPFQALLFFQVAVIDALVTGQSMQAMDQLSTNDGTSRISSSWWIVIAGVLVFLLALIPTLSQMWQLSLFGTLTAVGGELTLVIGCAVALANHSTQDITFGRPPVSDGQTNATLDFTMGVLNAFGLLAFAYGGHSVLPDIQASLHQTDVADSHRSMRKGLIAAYAIVFPSYLVICVIGYAAFGAEVSSFLPTDLNTHVPNSLITAIYVFLVTNTLALGAVYIQAAFTLMDDIFPCLRDPYDSGRYNLRQLVARFVFVALATFTAVALPFFGYLSALSGAICFTPLTVRTLLVDVVPVRHVCSDHCCSLCIPLSL